MTTPVVAAKAPVLVPFVCPICTATNEINLIALARAGTTDCTSCKKRLKAADVMRARATPRKA